MIKSLTVSPFASPFDFHIWVGISKDSENSKQMEPETCREKYISAVSGRKSLYIISKRK